MSLLRHDGHPRLHALQPFDDDPVAGLQALLDDDHAPLDRADLDDLDRHLVVGADDGDLVASLQLADRPLRNEDCSLPEVDGDTDLGVLAGPQQVFRIRERSRELDRAGLHVHLAADEERLPAMRENRAVRENELEVPHLEIPAALQRLLDGAVLVDPVQILLLAGIEVHLDGIDLRDRGHDDLVIYEIADLRDGDSRDAVDRGDDLRPVEIQLRLLEARPCALDVGLRRTLACLGVIQLLLTDRLFRGQRPVARGRRLRVVERRLVLSQGPLGLVVRRLELAGIDLEESFPGLDEIALLVVPAEDVALDLRPDLGVDEAVERADPFPVDGHVFLRDGRDLDGRRRRGRSLLLLAAGGAEHREGGEHSRDPNLSRSRHRTYLPASADGLPKSPADCRGILCRPRGASTPN